MYKLKINNNSEFNIERNKGELLINGAAMDADIQTVNLKAYHIILNGYEGYNAEIVSFDAQEKSAQIKINGNNYMVTAKDQFDLLLDQMGLSSLNATKVREIKAPMPGLVLKMFVNVGDEVKKGDNLFILEAMKMENIIKSPADVTVKAIKMKSGDKVEKGQVLLEFN
jgi:biotin carboxyl carrier protein